MAENWPIEAGADRITLFGRFELDRRQGCLLRAGAPVHLRPQAYEVLDYLAARQGRLITKDTLIAHLWHGRAVGDDSLVQCLRDVRLALGDEGAHVLRNVRGRGYIFDTSAAASQEPAAEDRAKPSSAAVPVPLQAATPAPTRRLHPALLLGVVLAATIGGGGFAVLLNRPAAPAIASVAVLPFEAGGGGGYTVDRDAYLLYLRGRHHALEATEAGMRQAIDLYEQALRVAPDFAPAHAAMAEAWRVLSIVGQVPSLQAFPQARAAALRALALDDRLPEAHVALGWILFSFDWDWAAAEQQFKAAIALNPQSPEAHRGYAHMLSNQSRHEEALVEIARARELDPRSTMINNLEGQMLFYAGRFDAAEARYRKVMEIVPDFWPAHLGMGRVHIARGTLDDALAALGRAVALSSNAVEPLTQLGYALAVQGDRDGALALLRQLEARSANSYVPAYAFAMIHNGLGDDGEALRYLEQSVARREVQATFIRIDTRWDRLRPNPRFVALLKQLHLD
jgi:DNA-binding winged helix-turn-helix (wHTH) protein/tetratricopeptide (TPR) repeat protein